MLWLLRTSTLHLEYSSQIHMAFNAWIGGWDSSVGRSTCPQPDDLDASLRTLIVEEQSWHLSFIYFNYKWELVSNIYSGVSMWVSSSPLLYMVPLMLGHCRWNCLVKSPPLEKNIIKCQEFYWLWQFGICSYGDHDI